MAPSVLSSLEVGPACRTLLELLHTPRHLLGPASPVYMQLLQLVRGAGLCACSCCTRLATPPVPCAASVHIMQLLLQLVRGAGLCACSGCVHMQLQWHRLSTVCSSPCLPKGPNVRLALSA